MGELKVKREDVNTTTSDIPGLAGYAETFLRRFRTLGFFVFCIPLVIMCVGSIGLAAGIGMYVYDLIHPLAADQAKFVQYVIMGLGFACGYFSYGFSLLFIVPAVNFINPFKPKAFRGPWYSLAAAPWYFQNGLTYMVRYTFLDLITPSPVTVTFYRLMGMKIGKGVVINTTNISDPCMITLEDYVTVGGSATIFAHYGQKGYLIIAPTVIGAGSNIGLKASIMGGCKVGKNVTIKPHTVLLPKTEVPDGETV
jgi:hypothetical protein